MKRILTILLMGIAFASYGQADQARFPKTPASGANQNKTSITDYNLKVLSNLYVPKKTSFNLNNGKDSSSALLYNDVIKKLGIYNGTKWDTLSPIPLGGTTGQALVKNSNSNYDYKWMTVGGSSLTLTTVGTSGVATYSGGILNIPNYTAPSYTTSNGIDLVGNDFQLNGNAIVAYPDYFNIGDGYSGQGGIELGTGHANIAAGGATTYAFMSASNQLDADNYAVELRAQNTSEGNKGRILNIRSGLTQRAEFNDELTLKGLYYATDFSPNWLDTGEDDLVLVNKKWVENKIAASGGGAVSSVFGRTGAVVATSGDYNTSQVTENTNLYYTEARVSANTDVTANTTSRHNALTIGTANGLSLVGQALSMALANGSVTGALNATDYTTFNNKQAQLNGTGFVKASGTTISYDNSTYYLASNPSSYINQAGARTAISLTTAGTSGVATYDNTTGVFNIPNYATGGSQTLDQVLTAGNTSIQTANVGTITASSKILGKTTTGTGDLQIGADASNGNFRVVQNGSSSMFGIYDSVNAKYYGFQNDLSVPIANFIGLGGWYSGVASLAGVTSASTNPIFGVVTTDQTGNTPGVGGTNFHIAGNKIVQTFNNTLDNGTGSLSAVKLFAGSGTTVPTAYLHLGAGTATAGTAPLKFTSGTNTTIAVTGQMEYNGTVLTFTPTGTTRQTFGYLGLAQTWSAVQTFVAPVLGAATATSINKVAITAPTTNSTLTLVQGSTLQTTGAFTLNLTSTANSTPTFPTGTGTLGYQLTGSASLNFPSTTSNTTNSLTITVTGAAVGDVVSLGIDAATLSVTGNYSFMAYVSAADTVTVKFDNNNPVTTLDPAAATFKVKVFK